MEHGEFMVVVRGTRAYRSVKAGNQAHDAIFLLRRGWFARGRGETHCNLRRPEGANDPGTLR